MQAKPNKFQFMMISRDEHSSQSLILNQITVIVSDDHVKLLGVVIDSKLNFSLLLLRRINWCDGVSNHSFVNSGADQRNYHGSASLAFMGIHW